MRFLFVRPEVCPWVSRFPTSGFLQIPPHDGHPCLRLYPSHYRADSGLSPVRNVRRQAHHHKAREKHCDITSPGLLSLRVTLWKSPGSKTLLPPLPAANRYPSPVGRLLSDQHAQQRTGTLEDASYLLSTLFYHTAIPQARRNCHWANLHRTNLHDCLNTRLDFHRYRSIISLTSEHRFQEGFYGTDDIFRT